MKIDSTEFGNITIDGNTYSHDVLMRLSGEVAKRKKKLSTSIGTKCASTRPFPFAYSKHRLSKHAFHNGSICAQQA